MKRAVILHGTDGSPDKYWQPWLKKQLEKHGYEVYAPLLPDNKRPNRKTYSQFLRDSGWDFTDNIVIGHSSGSTSLLNLLHEDWFPKIKATVLVGTFLNERLLEGVEWYEKGQFDDLFLDKYDPAVIKKKAGKVIMLHGAEDPYCDYGDAESFAKLVDALFITVKDAKHFTGNVAEIPQILDALRQEKLL